MTEAEMRIVFKIGSLFEVRWRRAGDSNPRDAHHACRFSRPVHSTALPALRGRPYRKLNHNSIIYFAFEKRTDA